MSKTVLIIEDIEGHYNDLKVRFSNYGINVVPDSSNDFHTLARLLRSYATSSTPENLLLIHEKIKQYTFDFVLIDVNLNDKDGNESGYSLAQDLFEKYYMDTELCFISNYAIHENSPNYIERLDGSTFDIEIYSKVILKLTGDSSESPITSKSDTLVPELKNKSQDTPSLILTVHPTLAKIGNWEKNILFEFISPIVHTAIKYTFFFILFTLALYPPAYLIFKGIKEEFNPFKLAEYTFIIFIPFLVTSGFYVFYIRSISPYIRNMRPSTDDVEKSSSILNLTKTLFVTSLVSYIILKIIDLLFNPKADTLILNMIVDSDNRWYILVIISLTIVSLLLFYYMIKRKEKK